MAVATLTPTPEKLAAKLTKEILIKHLKEVTEKEGNGYQLFVVVDEVIPGTKIEFLSLVIDRNPPFTQKGKTLFDVAKNPYILDQTINADFLEVVPQYYQLAGIPNPYHKAEAIVVLRIASPNIFGEKTADDLGMKDVANPQGSASFSIRTYEEDGLYLRVIDMDDMGHTLKGEDLPVGYKADNPLAIPANTKGNAFLIKIFDSLPENVKNIIMKVMNFT